MNQGSIQRKSTRERFDLGEFGKSFPCKIPRKNVENNDDKTKKKSKLARLKSARRLAEE